MQFLHIVGQHCYAIQSPRVEDIKMFTSPETRFTYEHSISVVYAGDISGVHLYVFLKIDIIPTYKNEMGQQVVWLPCSTRDT